MKFKKKPVVIEAIQFTMESRHECFKFLTCEYCARMNAINEMVLVIKTLEGDMSATLGDWIIRGIKGEFYPCKPDIFAATYEPVDETTKGGA